MSDLIFRVYEEDDSTVYFEVGTAAAHAHPYLQTPEVYGESEIDLLNGTARIGRARVRIIDPQTGASQAERWLTELLGNPAGYSECNGRRAVLLHATGEIITDGVCAGSRLMASYAGFEVELEDIRARAVDIPVFTRSGTTSVFPRGVVNGYGQVPGGKWLVPPTTPARGSLIVPAALSGNYGWIQLEGSAEQRDLLGYTLTDKMRDAGAFAWSDEGTAFLPHVEVWFRAVGASSWNVLSRMPIVRINFPSLTWASGFGLWREIGPRASSGRTPLAGIFVAATPEVPALPIGTTAVEMMVVYTGPPSEDFPFHYEGRAGDLLEAAIAGGYSSDEDGNPIDPRLRWDASKFSGASALPELNQPVRVRITEPAEDLREWLEEASRELGIAMALDELGRISPVGETLPDASADLAELNDDNCSPLAAWEHPIADAITQVEIVYPWDFYVPAIEDPEGTRSAGDGIRTVEQRITVRPQDTDPASTVQQVMGIKIHPIDGFLLRGVRREDASGDTLDESRAQFTLARAHNLIDRYAFGGQYDTARAMRSDPDVAALRVGDWVIDGRGWSPNYATGERGRNHLSQVIAIKDLNPAWRELRLLDAAPYANPIGEPELGTVTGDAAGVIAVPVDTVPAGGEVRVEYAISATEPLASSGLWTFLGRTAEELTLYSPPLPAGSTVWIRARGEGIGRRPSVWTDAVSVALAGTPRLLSGGVFLDGATARVHWYANAAAGGVRVYFEVHDPETDPGTLTSFQDFDADTIDLVDVLSVALSSPVVAAGQAITVSIVPYTGFGSGAVTGTAGEAITAAAIRPAVSDDVAAALEELEAELIDAIEGGIDEGEAITIADRIFQLNNRKAELDKRYDAIFAHDGIDLLNPYRDNLANAKGAYNSAHTALINGITSATADGEVSGADLTAINGLLATYRTALEGLNTRMEEALDSIEDHKDNSILSELLDVEVALDNLDTYVNGALQDEIIDEAEAGQIGAFLDLIDSEYLEWEAAVNLVYVHPAIVGGPVALALDNAFQAWRNDYLDLQAAADAIRTAGTVSPAARTAYNNAWNAHQATLPPMREAFEEAIDAIKDAGDQSVLDELLDVEVALNNLDIELTAAVEDGLTEAEVFSLSRARDEVVQQYYDFYEKANYLLLHPLLTGTPETELNTWWNNWVLAYGFLLAEIDSIIADGTSWDGDLSSYSALKNSYIDHIQSLRVRFEQATDAIREAGLDTAVDEVYDAINNLSSAVVSTFRDDVISEADATQLAEHINTLWAEYYRLQGEFNSIYNHADLIEIDAITGDRVALLTDWNNFDAWHNNTEDAILAAIADSRISATDRSNVDAAIANYEYYLNLLAARLNYARQAIKERGDRKAYQPKVQAIIEWISAGVVVVGLAVNDPKRLAANLAWQAFTQGVPTSITNVFSGANYTIGADAYFYRSQQLSVPAGKDVTFVWTLWYYDADNIQRVITGEIPITNMQTRSVTRRITYSEFVGRSVALEYPGGMAVYFGSPNYQADAGIAAPVGSTLATVSLRVILGGLSMDLTLRVLKVVDDDPLTWYDLVTPVSIAAGAYADEILLTANPNYVTTQNETYIVAAEISGGAGDIGFVKVAEAVFTLPDYAKI